MRLCPDMYTKIGATTKQTERKNSIKYMVCKNYAPFSRTMSITIFFINIYRVCATLCNVMLVLYFVSISLARTHTYTAISNVSFRFEYFTTDMSRQSSRVLYI